MVKTIGFQNFYKIGNNYLCQFSTNIFLFLKECDFKNYNTFSNKGYYLESENNQLMPSISKKEMVKSILNKKIHLDLTKNDHYKIYTIVNKFPVDCINLKNLITISFDNELFIKCDLINMSIKYFNINDIEMKYFDYNSICTKMDFLGIWFLITNKLKINIDYISTDEVILNILKIIDEHEFDYVNGLTEQSVLFKERTVLETESSKNIILDFKDLSMNLNINISKQHTDFQDIELLEAHDEFTYIDNIYSIGNGKIYNLNLFEPTHIDEYVGHYINMTTHHIPIREYFNFNINVMSNKNLKRGAIVGSIILLLTTILPNIRI
jgi:hypothetical protein